MLSKVIKITLQLLLLTLIVSGLVWKDLIIYGLTQGKGQLNVILNSESIDDAVTNKTYPDSLNYKLKLIQEIKQFAVDSIGINPSKNYSTIYNQNGKPILYTLSACEAYSLKEKEWNFPFLGMVAYKGYFNKAKADEEMERLKNEGYDVDVYSPSGWSTLGWFQDPILSNMLYKKDAQLANLIIHELTHGTLFVKNDVTFNENLANFIGEKGTVQFLIYKYGIHSKQYKEYINKLQDTKTYTRYILSSTRRLDSLYTGIVDLDNILKEEKKQQLISAIISGVKSLPLSNKESYIEYSLQAKTKGNAFFMAFKRYDSQYDDFEKEFVDDFNADLLLYMNYLKEKYPSL